MTIRGLRFTLPSLLVLAFISASPVAAEQEPAAVIRALLANSATTDFLGAKLAIDRLVDPGSDAERARADVEGMVATIEKMLAALPPKEAVTSLAKLNALKAFLYRPGHWNGNKPFTYDMETPRDPGHRLLSHYLATRKGNCVSMPMLLVILGERLGLKVTLSTAPQHYLVKYTDAERNVTYNLEATSGAGFTRESYYREHMPMGDQAIASGVYLKTLSRREAIAVIATPLIDHLTQSQRFEEAIAVADAILEAYPANALALLAKGSVYYLLLQRDIVRYFPDPRDIPPELLGYAQALYDANLHAFAQAEALGWRETDGIKK